MTYFKQLQRWRERRKRILTMLASGKPRGEVAKTFGISKQRLSQIVNGVRT